MTTELEDEYGDRYKSAEGFDLGARNDFTVAELQDALNDGEEVQVDFVYPKRDDVDNRGYSLTEKFANGNPMYKGYRYRPSEGVDPIGYRLLEIEDFNYEGGILKDFGTFTVVDSGNLGDGHEAWVLWRHEESGRLFRRGGWYSSWGSGEMDEDIVEVVPAEVKVVRYADINDPTKIFDNPAVTV